MLKDLEHICGSFSCNCHIFFILLFLSKGNTNSLYVRFKQEFESIILPLVEETVKTFGLTKEDAEDLLNQMLIFANGIAVLVITDADSFSKETVSRSISQVCIGIVITDRLRDGTMDLHAAEEMAKYCVSGIIPQKRR